MKVGKKGTIVRERDQIPQEEIKVLELLEGKQILHKEHEFQPMKVMAKSS